MGYSCHIYFIYAGFQKNIKLMSILIITVNYKDSKPTENLIKSIINCKISTTLKIIIVDNESSEDSLLSLNMIRNKSKFRY